jgi:hypothetical protein
MPRADALSSAKDLRWRVAARHGGQLWRTDVRAVAQEHASNTEAFSSHPAASETPARSGGPRAGRGAGVSVGRPRCRRIRSITVASSMRARWKTTIEPFVFLRALMAGPHGNDVMARASQGLSAIKRRRPPHRGHARTSHPHVRANSELAVEIR